MSGPAQKFIARNRAPRVQIEYDVELYGSQKKVQLPFVMGVMSDLAGKSRTAQPTIEDRKFLEIDVDNFDDRMKAMAPRVDFSVPNTLTGEGNLSVDLTFEKMSDFSPAAIAAKLDPLRPLLEARTQLANLMAYMDGKAGAEALIERILADPALLTALTGAGGDGADHAAALDSLRDLAPDEAPPQDEAASVLDALRDAAPEETPQEDMAGTVLDGLKAEAPSAPPPEAPSSNVLDALRDAAPADAAKEDTATNALDSLKAAQPDPEPPEDQTGGILDALRDVAPEAPDAKDDSAEALASLQAAPDEVTKDDDTSGAVLGALRDTAPQESEEEDSSSAALDSLAAVPVPQDAPDTTDDLLADLATAAPEEPAEVDDTDDLLADLASAAPEEAAEPDGTDDLLADLAAAAPEEAAEEDGTDELLADLAAAAPEEASEEDGTDDLLADLAAAVPEEAAEVDGTDDLLADLAAAAPEETSEADDNDDLLADLARAALEETAEADETDDLLADLASAAPEEAAEVDETDDLLADLATVAPEETAEADGTDDLLADLASAAPEETAEADETDDLLADLASAAPEETAEADETDDLLADLASAAPDETAEADETDDLLADLATAAPEETAEADETDDLLADLASAAPEVTAEVDDTDDLLADLASAAPEETVEVDETDDLLADFASAAPEETAEADDTDDLLADLASAAPEETTEADETVGLDDLLGDLDTEDDPTTAAAPEEGDALDDLLGNLGDEGDTPDEPVAAAETGLDDLLGDLADDAEQADSETDDLDDLLGDLATDEPDPDAGGEGAPTDATLTGEPEFAYGTLGADRPSPERLNRKRFRIAILGDFSGRAARGLVETGDALAARRATLLDPDTVEDVIESFATDLVLPIGREGAGVALSLKGLDSLHPDELYENVDLFSELVGLRQQLQSGATAENAATTLRAWAEKHGQRVRPPKTRSGGNAVRADLKLSAFQELIGDTRPKPPEASPAGELIARIVGPHVRALPDPDAAAMTAAVDAALSDAMRMVLHHPEFQSLEAQWRTLDLIARTIEDDDTLDVMLYDISAEEIAADLATHDELSQSGFARLLTEEPLDAENGRGGYSALIGLYTFEETPPHAELLGRISRVAAHVDAPFLAAIAPGFLEVEKKDRHSLVANAWDTLRAMPEAGHLGLLTPRFMLRRPYGAKTEPIYEFAFEEFTMAEGLSGLLWANPAVLAAILLARSFRKNGPSLGLGSVMSLGEVPYHYVTDRYGDQVALPCTERNLTQSRVEFVMARGFMPVVSIKGRDEVRLASFQSLAGGDILGPWSGVAPPQPSPPNPAPPPAAGGAPDGEGDVDLDELLAGFGDDLDPGGDGDDGEDGGDIEADLAALLDDL